MPPGSAILKVVAFFLFAAICITIAYQWFADSVSPPTTPLPPIATPAPIIFHEPACQGEDLANCPRSLIQGPASYRTAQPSYPLTACIIDESISSFLSGILCYLHDPQTFMAANATFHDGAWNREYCSAIGNDRLSSAPVQDSIMMTLVRDPLERFISGYVSQCLGTGICHGCAAGDLTCFVDAQYRRILLYGTGQAPDSNRGEQDALFFPQNWFCHFSQALPAYRVIRYGGSGGGLRRMTNELVKVLRGAKVERKHIKFIRAQFLQSPIDQPTARSDKMNHLMQKARESEHIKRLMLRMYYHDYLLFRFSLPIT